jgi:hypothetical protein
MTAALWRLIKRVAADLGPEAADALLVTARAWMADPANSGARERLVTTLAELARRAGGLTGAMAGMAATAIGPSRQSPAAWERTVMAARYVIPQHPSGEARAAALEAYLALTEAAPQIVVAARNPHRAERDVLMALELEARMLATEALGPRERQLALEVNDRVRRALVEQAATRMPHRA